MHDREALIEALSFDHRASIVRYLHDQATEFEVIDQRDVAITLRAQASNIAILADVRDGREGIASPAMAIIVQVTAAFGGVSYAEVVGPGVGTKQAVKARHAAMWVCKKRLGWSDEQLESAFNRERSTINGGVHSAEPRRSTDVAFKRITDNLIEQRVRCENCQHPLVRC